jgi:hypothetical protein
MNPMQSQLTLQFQLLGKLLAQLRLSVLWDQ